MDQSDCGPLSSLPANCPLKSFETFEDLELAAEKVYRDLEENKGEGNQYLVVLDLGPQAAIDRLFDDKSVLGGIPYRFMSEGSTGLIKIIQGFATNCSTQNFHTEIEWVAWMMGVDCHQDQLGASTTHPATVSSKRKEPDQCFWPNLRRPLHNRLHGWPTSVIETGVSESLDRLRADARWWFENSSGETRFVILICVEKSQRKVYIEQWQLAPPDLPTLITSAMLDQLRHQSPPAMPPLTTQTADRQHPYCIQELTVTPGSGAVTNAPLVIRFRAMMDRAPQGNETDFVLSQQRLLAIFGHL